MWSIILLVAFLVGVQNNSWSYFVVALIAIGSWKIIGAFTSGLTKNNKLLAEAEAKISRLKEEIVLRDARIVDFKKTIETLSEDDHQEEIGLAFKQGFEQAIKLYVNDRSQFDGILSAYFARLASQAKAEQLRKQQEQDRRERRERDYQARMNPKPVGSDWWTVLGVDRSCTLAEAKKAYHRLAMKFHTDNKETGDKIKMTEINLAFEKAERAKAA